MAGNQTVGTPDGQRGISNPGIELGKVTSPGVTVTVTTPPNVDALWVYTKTLVVGSVPTVVGVTSGINYEGYFVNGAYIYPVQTTIDQQYIVTVPAPLADTWYVVGQAWGAVVTMQTPTQLLSEGGGLAPGQFGALVAGTDGSNGHTIRTDASGDLYTVAVAPSAGLGFHPPVEVKMVGLNAPGTGTAIVPAPGAGKRIRVLATSITTDVFSTMTGTYSGGSLLLEGTAGSASAAVGIMSPFPASGIPLDTNTAVILSTTSGHGLFRIWYTVENV